MQSRSILFLPIGAITVSVLALYFPFLFAGYGKAIVPLLGVVMFSMGMTLTPDDFKRVLTLPQLVFIGVSLQYLLMPFIAWLISIAFNLPVLLAAGLILVGACPGGTASNVVCYLSRGNVALSITLTAVSTLLAALLTPLISYLYIDQSINVPVKKMMWQLFYIVVLPVTAGVLINTFYHQRIEKIKSSLPLISVLSIIFIIAVIVARNQAQLMETGILILLAVVLHNLFGLLLGYQIPKLLRFDKKTCKTISIEVGMQNSGLGVVLAEQYFSAVAALPGAIFSLWHNISGALLAVIWSRDEKNNDNN